MRERMIRAPSESSAAVVHCIAVEGKHRGQIWALKVGLGTLDPGDGPFTFYQPDPAGPDSANDPFVSSIVENQRRVLRPGTFNGGIKRFDPETERAIHCQNDGDDERRSGDETVVSISIDRDEADGGRHE
ncbi:MAG: hypothetical protein U9R72_15070 [Chloroflexota bacterium]|nr:hypothetical protein [Chloroflexota bacterium]